MSYGRKKCIPRSLSLARKVGGGKSPGENPPENNKSTTTELEEEEAKMKSISRFPAKNFSLPPFPCAYILCCCVWKKGAYLDLPSSFCVFFFSRYAACPFAARGNRRYEQPFSLPFLLLSRQKRGGEENLKARPKSIPPECEIHRLFRAHVSY